MKQLLSIVVLSVFAAFGSAQAPDKAPKQAPAPPHKHKPQGNHHGKPHHHGHWKGGKWHHHHHHGHYHAPRYYNYHLRFGNRFRFGFFYAGPAHYHWTYSYFDNRYGTVLYYDPYAASYFYWCAPHNRYYPVSYAPLGYVFPHNVQPQPSSTPAPAPDPAPSYDGLPMSPANP